MQPLQCIAKVFVFMVQVFSIQYSNVINDRYSQVYRDKCKYLWINRKYTSTSRSTRTINGKYKYTSIYRSRWQQHQAWPSPSSPSLPWSRTSFQQKLSKSKPSFQCPRWRRWLITCQQQPQEYQRSGRLRGDQSSWILFKWPQICGKFRSFWCFSSFKPIALKITSNMQQL